jgi:REP element-mobilizing transposase RayT
VIDPQDLVASILGNEDYAQRANFAKSKKKGNWGQALSNYTYVLGFIGDQELEAVSAGRENRWRFADGLYLR